LARRVLEPHRVSLADARASFIGALRREARRAAGVAEESGPGLDPPSGGLTTSDDASGAATTNAGSDSRASAPDRLPGLGRELFQGHRPGPAQPSRARRRGGRYPRPPPPRQRLHAFHSPWFPRKAPTERFHVWRLATACCGP